MSKIKKIPFNNNRFLYVEMQEAEIEPVINPQSGNYPGLPDNATALKAASQQKMEDAMKILRDNIQGLAHTINESLKEYSPQELTMEISVGFRGTTSPIPVIVSGEASGAIKVTVKWGPLNE